MKRKPMQHITLVHNPKAGDEEHSKKELKSLIEENGFECTYLSTKDKDWKEFKSNTDILMIAGGDGTVRKVTKELLLQRKLLEHIWPIALLPVGTANNIAKTLGVEGSSQEIISSLRQAAPKKFDVGKVSHVNNTEFFLESLGYGIFPYLMKEMKNIESKEDTPDEALKKAMKKLLEIIDSYHPRACELEVDGADHSGTYLLAEIMNTKSIGPNLFLAPDGDPGDGEFDVVLIPEADKEKFSAYVQQKLDGEESNYDFYSVRAKKIKISWQGTHVHVDDEIIKLEESAEVEAEIKPGLLEFLLPNDGTK
jgi:diacylglycerol kinase family enzyme